MKPTVRSRETLDPLPNPVSPPVVAANVQRPLRVCLDASVVVAGVASRSGAAAATLVLVSQRRILGYASDAIVAEYHEALTRKSVAHLLHRRGVTNDEAENLLRAFVRELAIVRPGGNAPPCRDERDRMYLHCAVTVPVDYLVSNDGDLLAEAAHHPFAIVRPSDFLRVVRVT